MNQIRQLIFIVWLVVTMASPLAAQPNVPVKLALLTESAATQLAADLLTASFSTNAGIQLAG